MSRFALRLLLFIVVLTSGCSLTRRVPEGEWLYTGSKLVVEYSGKAADTKKLESSAEALLQNPAPNKQFLGVRWRLRLYNLFYSNKEKGLFPWLQRKLGEAPVLYDEQLTRQTSRLLEDLCSNEGFFRAKTESELQTAGKKAGVLYHVALTEPYTVAAYSNLPADSVMSGEIARSSGQSLIRPGMRYELSRLKDERERIALALRKKGYYFFTDDFLRFTADTALGNRRIHLELQLKPEVAAKDLTPQTVERIFVYPDFRFSREAPADRDTASREDMILIFEEPLVKAQALQKAIVLKPGKIYSPDDHRNTLRRLSLLPLFQFVDVQYERAPPSDSSLDVRIYLAPRQKYNVEGSAGLSLRSNAYIGPEFSLTLADRNFRSLAEQLRLQALGNFNIPLTGAFESYQKIGLNSQLLRQGLVIPFRRAPLREDLVGQTRIGLEYAREQVRLPLRNLKTDLEKLGLDELLKRLEADSSFAPYARINRFDAGYAYQWIKRPDIRHELTPLQIILQDAHYEIDQMRDLLRSREAFSTGRSGFLNLERMLIFKPSYIIAYDSRLRQIRRHNFFDRSRIALSGNILLTKEELFTLNSLQTLFLQLENDWRYYFRVYDRQTFAFRIASSIAIPFRRNAVLPFIDLYNVGGANSIRAFPPRQLGPGSVEPAEETFFLASNGDLKLEGSAEWRQKLSSLFELALFVDAGNVWDLQGGEDKNEEAVFRWDRFYRQIAIGAGFGFRFDFEVLLLRLDFAFPLSIPWLPEGRRWVGDEISPGSAQWRKDNLNFNLAFGYPF